MEFPETWEEFEKSYGFTDSDEVYTNGSRLIQSFRVKQWLDHINKPTQMVDKSNFDKRQYKAELQGAYDCGYYKAMSIIDDAKAEIEQKARPNELGGRGNGKAIRYGLCIALEIIDKYRTESEDKE